MTRKVEWYKDGHFWRRGDADADYTPQDRGDGTGDLIWNTLTKIEEDQDCSPWAQFAFVYCCDLLAGPDRKRYPDRFLTGYETKNMIQYRFKKWKRKIQQKRTTDSLSPIYKPQGRMSRDPFIALATTFHFLMLNVEDETAQVVLWVTFRMVTIPLHLQYAIGTMTWWRKMHYENHKHLVKKRLNAVKAKGTIYAYKRRWPTDFYQDKL